MEEIINNIYKNILDVIDDPDADENVLKNDIVQNISAAIKLKISSKTILEQGLLPAMEKVGSLFKEGEIFLPEVLGAAEIMKSGMAILKPYFIKENVKPKAKVVITTVEGDIHDIGKNLVAMALEGAGYQIHDLGINAKTADIVKIVENEKPQILGLSALLTTTVPKMAEVINLLKTKKLNKQTKVIIGGAPVSKEYASSIGADAYGKDAFDAVDVVGELLKK